MKRTWSCLVPVILPACMVETPVVKGNQDLLGADLTAWCESTCARAAECEPELGEECPESCTDYFEETYVGKTDACTEAGLRLMDCMDKTSCEELTNGESCNQGAEEARCLGSMGLAACNAESVGVGGGAGFGGTGGAPPVSSCDYALSDCTDDHEYALACTGFGASPVCQCSIDGEVTGQFAPIGSSCPDSFLAKQICAWPLVVPRGEPELPPLVTCRAGGGHGSAGGGPVAECGLFFEDCSDGRSYAVDCTGAAGSVDCTCSVDGEPIRTQRSPTGVCPFVFGGDGGIIAANYACGFRITPY